MQIQSQINTNSADFKENAAHNEGLAETLRERQRLVAFARPERVLQRHAERGKLLVRERIEAILDPESPFLELSPLAAWELYDGEAPSAGIVTGIGRVWGVAAGRATSVHTSDGLQATIASLSRSLNVFQRRFGSTPLITTRSWSAVGILA